MPKKRVVIMGAAGRDFHNFNVYYRDNPDYEVVAFTATQIPDIDGRKYPPDLAGKLYPDGIPILSESDLINVIKEKKVDEVVFAYSDVSHNYVMDKACAVIAAGADFRFIGAEKSMLKSTKPVISICAVRTGCGKSQTTRKVATILQELGKKVTVIRHPMPYGDLNKQRVQRFARLEDLDKHECTIEEREEYEPHINTGIVVYAGVDYKDILSEAEKESDIIIWDGGNNDLPFYVPDLEIVVVDPHRPGHELLYYPGTANLYRADVVVINKVDSTTHENIEIVENNIKLKNPKAVVIHADSPIIVDKPEEIKGKKVLVVEDGPTLTHGEMKYGAGIVAARQYGAHEIIDPRPYAVGSIKKTFEKYPHIGTLLPAMGYSKTQMKELEKTINDTPCDMVVVATPIDLGRLLKINKPYKRVRYELKEKEALGLKYLIESRVLKSQKRK
ncbi:MAG: cyclic 2,3-diphosphoglycerate synthase [Myxococcota bacterium]